MSGSSPVVPAHEPGERRPQPSFTRGVPPFGELSHGGFQLPSKHRELGGISPPLPCSLRRDVRPAAFSVAVPDALLSGNRRTASNNDGPFRRQPPEQLDEPAG